MNLVIILEDLIETKISIETSKTFITPQDNPHWKPFSRNFSWGTSAEPTNTETRQAVSSMWRASWWNTASVEKLKLCCQHTVTARSLCPMFPIVSCVCSCIFYLNANWLIGVNLGTELGCDSVQSLSSNASLKRISHD